MGNTHKTQRRAPPPEQRQRLPSLPKRDPKEYIREQYLKHCRNAYEDIARGDIKDPVINSLAKYATSECIVENNKNISENFKLSRIENPVDNDDFCKLLSTKKTKYYIYTYDPLPIIQNIQALDIEKEIIDKYVDNIKKIFDLGKNASCCNCISITLYRKENSRTPIVNYLKSIKRSVKNVRKFLPRWIVRLYLDTSVYNYVSTTTDDIGDSMEIVQFLLKQPHVEIYTYLCSNILSGNTPLEKIRTTRYKALYDREVNVAAIREADGVVTYEDCHNLEYFEGSPQIFYLAPWINGILIEEYGPLGMATLSNVTGPTSSYSAWLRYYKKNMDEDFYENKKAAAYDLLAGLLAVKLRIKSEIYYGKIAELNQLFNNIADKDDNDAVTVGFDEMLLLRIYKDVISFEPELTTDLKSYSIKNRSSIIKLLDAVFIAYNRNMIICKLGDLRRQDVSNMSEQIIAKLKNQGIAKDISEKLLEDSAQKLFSNCSINKKECLDNNTYAILYPLDALMIDKIIQDKPFSLEINATNNRSMFRILSSHLLNAPYTRDFERVCDPLYDKQHNPPISMQGGRNNRHPKFSKIRKFNLAY